MTACCGPVTDGVSTRSHGTSLSTWAYTHLRGSGRRLPHWAHCGLPASLGVLHLGQFTLTGSTCRSVTSPGVTPGLGQAKASWLSDRASGGGLDRPRHSKNCCTAPTPRAVSPATGQVQPLEADQRRTSPLSTSGPAAPGVLRL